MIATGSLILDRKGNFVKYETFETNSAEVGSVRMWRDVRDKKHPKRTSTIGHAYIHFAGLIGGTRASGQLKRIRFNELKII
jgi:hypothetical protein